ncbi:MAG: multicopper oxidase domain-containing protein [Cyanobium sp.]
MPTAEQRYSRRQCLQAAGLLLAGGGCVGAALSHRVHALEGPEAVLPFDPQEVLRSFERGRMLDDNGRRLRLFDVEARSLTLPLGGDLVFKAWTLNGRIPGPTLRGREGERIRVVFRNGDSSSHSLHFHGVHPAGMDGIEPVLRGNTTTYEFDLPRAGLYPYHCHVAPVSRHVGKGLFGLLIVDPPTPRAPADELVLAMGGYDLNNSGRNAVYAFNGIPDAYMHSPIRIQQNTLVRLYLLNMTELEAPLSFHLHANEFRVIRPDRADTNDVVTLAVSERQILEFSYPYSGRYMFHPHQDQIAERGCMGYFDVVPA